MTTTASTPLRSCIPRFVLLCAAVLSLALNATAAVPPPDKLLPDDTLIVLTVPDAAKLREISKTSPQMQLWNDPALKPFREKLVNKFKEEVVTPLERELDIKFDDYTSLPQGQMTMALTQNGWQGTGDQLPAVLLLLDAKDKSPQLKSNLANLRKKWVAAGKTLKTEKIRNLEFWVLSLSSNDVPKSLQMLLGNAGNEAPAAEGDAKKPAPKDELIIGQVESLLIVGNSAKAVEKVVVRLTGGSSPVLGDVAEFEANRLALFRDAPFYGWINAKAFISPLSVKPPTKEDEAPNPFAMFSPDKIIAATGLSGLKTIAFAFQYAPDGSTFQAFMGVPESGRQGLFKIFTGEARESGPPSFVPADAVKFQRWRIDGQKAWATLQTILNDISPQITSTLNFLMETANNAAREKDPDFDIKKNLFGNLGDDLMAYEKNPRGKTLAELTDSPSLFLVGSPRPEQLASALKNLFAMAGQQVAAPTEREFLGRKIFSIKLPAVPLPTSTGETPRSRLLNYAASGGYLALSTDAAILEEYLRSGESPQKPLRETPGFADAVAKAGGSRTLLFAYENQAETARAGFELLRQMFGAKTNANESGLSGPYAIPFDDDSGFKDWVDFSLLPPFEKLSRYFYISVITGTANVDGFALKAYAPTPPQLKK